MDLSSKRSLTDVSDVNHLQSVHHRLFTLPVGIRETLATFKIRQLKSVSSSLK